MFKRERRLGNLPPLRVLLPPRLSMLHLLCNGYCPGMPVFMPTHVPPCCSVNKAQEFGISCANLCFVSVRMYAVVVHCHNTSQTVVVGLVEHPTRHDFCVSSFFRARTLVNRICLSAGADACEGEAPLSGEGNSRAAGEDG